MGESGAVEQIGGGTEVGGQADYVQLMHNTG